MRSYSGRLITIFLVALFVPFFLSWTAFSAEKEAPPQSTEPGNPLLTPLQVKERIDKGGLVMMIDVRSAQEFNSMHIAGSVSVPLAQIGSLVNALPREADIVFY